METLCQVMIFITGAPAIWLLSRKEGWRRWGYILGILGQPFWYITSYQNDQMGLFILSFFYTYSWFQGVWNYWIKSDDLK